MSRGKVGDTLSMAILGLCCGGTFIALALTSVAKKQGLTGPPEKPDYPWLKEAEASVEGRLKRLEGALPAGAAATARAAAGTGNGSGGGGGSKPAS